MAVVYRLDQFEGPLDLLLHLIQKAEIRIEDIFVSHITEQYLAYMDQVEELDMDTASDFLQMSATLLLIKSRSLLPRPPKPEPQEEESPEAELIRQLTEYKKYKEAGEVLRTREMDYKDIYFKLPEEWIQKDAPIELKKSTVDALMQAFEAVLSRVTDEDAPSSHDRRIGRDRYTVEDRMRHLMSVLKRKKGVAFDDLFEGEFTRSRVVNTFLAVLELLKAGRLSVIQDEVFGGIWLEHKADR